MGISARCIGKVGLNPPYADATLTENEKGPRHWHDPFKNLRVAGLALTGLKPALRLVDHIDAALTAHDAAIAMTLLERAEGVTYLHGRFLHVTARIAPWVAVSGLAARRIHGGRYWDRTSDPFDVNEVLYR